MTSTVLEISFRLLLPGFLILQLGLNHGDMTHRLALEVEIDLNQLFLLTYIGRCPKINELIADNT